ncbi:hypothetical protein H4R33_005374 [Dimargaris cristalligena]|nr:hypothetical protein H4R33_005374 [Dimargaris cristalligena]
MTHFDIFNFLGLGNSDPVKAVGHNAPAKAGAATNKISKLAKKSLLAATPAKAPKSPGMESGRPTNDSGSSAPVSKSLYHPMPYVHTKEGTIDSVPVSHNAQSLAKAIMGRHTNHASAPVSSDIPPLCSRSSGFTFGLCVDGELATTTETNSRESHSKKRRLDDDVDEHAKSSDPPSKRRVAVTSGPKSSYTSSTMSPAFVGPFPGKNLLSVKDLSDIVSECIGAGNPNTYIDIKHKENLNQIVVLYVPYLDVALGLHDHLAPQFFTTPDGDPAALKSSYTLEDIQAISSTQSLLRHMPNLTAIFERVYPTLATVVSRRFPAPYDTIFETTVRKNIMDQRTGEYLQLFEGLDPSKPQTYLMSNSQLENNSYPPPLIHLSYSDDPHNEWTDTEAVDADIEQARFDDEQEYEVLSVDCEMCMTRVGNELTRVSVVNFEGRVLMDELVKPFNPITNYVTQYSGITPSMLKNVTTSLADAQGMLKKLIGPRTILVGQSLNSDLNALKMTHPLVVDTSVIFTTPRGNVMADRTRQKPSLRWLTQKYLHRSIQDRTIRHGHDSIEDALACIDLLKLKLAQGPLFGVHFGETIPLVDGVANTPCPPRFAERAVTDRFYQRAALVGPTRRFTAYNTPNSLLVATDHLPEGTDPVRLILDYAPLHALTVTQLTTLADLYATRYHQALTPSAPDLVRALRTLDDQLNAIWEGLGEHTGLLVTSGHGDMRLSLPSMKKYTSLDAGYRRRISNEGPEKPLRESDATWSELDQAAMDKALQWSRLGISLMAIRPSQS